MHLFHFVDFTCKWSKSYFSISADLNSLSLISSRSIHVDAQGEISFLFMAHIPSSECMCLRERERDRERERQRKRDMLFIQSSVNGHLGCFYNLAIVNNAAMNLSIHVSFQISFFLFFGYISMSEIAGSYGSSIFSVLKKLQTVFLSDWINLHFLNSVQGCPFLHILTNVCYL